MKLYLITVLLIVRYADNSTSMGTWSLCPRGGWILVFRSLRPASVKIISSSDGLSPAMVYRSEVMRVGSSMRWVRNASLTASRNLNFLLSLSLVVLQSSQLIDGKFVSPKITV